MKRLLLASVFALTAAGVAHADETILAFSQAGAGSPITGTASAGTTTITTVSTPVDIGFIIAGPLPVPPDFLTLTATSSGPAASVTVLGVTFVDQAFSGSFCITSGPGCTGTNFLSGTFTDAVFGSGSSLTLSASNSASGEKVSFSSSVIPASDLLAPEGLSLAFATVAPPVGVTPGGCSGTPGCTIASFTSSVAGDFSAGVPEPASLALLGSGLLGLGYIIRKRRRT